MTGRPSGPPEPGAGDRELVERELRARVSAVLTGRRGPGLVATVEGPPGIGKTHLLDRLTGDAPVAGAVVRRAGGDDRHLRHGLAIAAQLLGGPPEGPHPGDCVSAQVDAWCRAGPVLLCIDDAHRLDTASIHLLRRLAWAGRDLPLALVIGLRPFPVRSVLEPLRRSALGSVLPPMGPADVEELVRERLGAWPSADLAGVLHRAAGNPLFVLLLVEDLRSRGLLVRSGPDRIGVSSDPGTVPAGLEDLVLTHLGQLDDAVLELLQAQAVLGRSATLEELAAVLYVPAGTAEETARAATRTGMVQLDGDRLAFVHDLYRGVVYGGIEEATRRAVHRRAAEVLVSLGAQTSGPQVAEEQDCGWISDAAGRRSSIDARSGRPEQALARLDALRPAGLPLGSDLPGLAVLEAQGSQGAATTPARGLRSTTPARGPTWVLALAVDVARVAVVSGERSLRERVTGQVDRLGAPEAALPPPARTLTAGLQHGEGAEAGSAAQTLEDLGFVLAAAYAWEECACLHAAAGDRQRATAAMERALSTYEAVGASTDRGRLLSRMRALGVRRGPRVKHAPATRGWAALTPTERQVADLVHQGLTNPEIAARLFVSPRTVQSHVSHILAKLDLRSRVEIAARRNDVGPA